MVYCFASKCTCHQETYTCSFFRFPKPAAKRSQWERLCRNQRRLRENDRICSCHFKDGKKENGPSIFPWTEGKLFEFPDPPKPAKAKKRKTTTTENVTTIDVSNQQQPADNDQFDHAYCCPPIYEEKHGKLQKEIEELKAKTDQLERELRDLKLNKKPMSIEDIKHDDAKMLLYTSMHYDVFLILQRTLERFNIAYYGNFKVTTITLADQLLITLMKLRLGAKDLDLSVRFNTSRTTISNIFYTMTCALHELLCVGIMFQGIPSQLKCRGSLPQSFGDFVSARGVIDATEITQDIPGNLNDQNDCYSSYKSRHTVKAVTCVAPNAAIVWSSKLYPGSVSDVAITEHSELLSNFVPGDLILADKGFTIFDKLPPGVNLNIPPFLRGKSYFTKQEADLCFKIGKARIHVERANERIKNFDILNHIPAHLRPLSTKIFQVCCCLVNFQDPLLKEIADKYNM